MASGFDELAGRDASLISELKMERALVEGTIDELNALFNPFNGDLMSGNRGSIDDDLGPVFDTTGMHYAHKLTNTLISKIFPPNAQWIRLSLPVSGKPSMRAKQALDMTNRRFLYAVEGSNFFHENTLSISEVLVGGNTALALEREDDGDGGLFAITSLDFSRVWRRSNKAGKLEVIVVEYTMSAGEAFDFFEKKPGPAVLEMLKNSEGAASIRRVKYYHILERNRGFNPDGIRLPSKKKWSSRWISVTDGIGRAESYVRVSGMDDSVYLIASFMKRRNQEYAYGLGHIGRSDAAGANASYRTALDAWANAISPPLMVADRDQLSGQLGPNGVVVVRAGHMKPTPLNYGTDLQSLMLMLDRPRENIKDLFLADITSIPETQERSAQATIARQANSLIQLSTFAESLRCLHTTEVQMILNHMYNAGRLPEIDILKEELEGWDMNFIPVFVSPFFTAQRMSSTQQTMDFYSALAEQSNLIGDDSIKKQLFSGINHTAYADVLGEAISVDHRMFYTEEEAEQNRAAEGERNAQAQQQQMMLEIARANAADPASQTPSLLGRPTA